MQATAAASIVHARASPPSPGTASMEASVDATLPDGPTIVGAGGATVSTVQLYDNVTFWTGTPPVAVTVTLCVPSLSDDALTGLLQDGTTTLSTWQVIVGDPLVVKSKVPEVWLVSAAGSEPGLDQASPMATAFFTVQL